jgi:hypothetical protein
MLGMSECFIPYRLYKVKIYDRGATVIRLLAVDSVSGTLDPIEFSGTTLESGCHETRNVLPQKLSEDETRAIVLRQARRIVFSSALIQSSNPSIEVDLVQSDFYLSYWIGFYGDKKDMDLLVLNATILSYEGGKLTECVKAWIR